MSCDCAEQVSLLIDGELAAAEAREVERHLLECVECQELRADFLGLRQQLMSYPTTRDLSGQKRALDGILSLRAEGRRVSEDWFGFQWTFGKAALAFASLLLIGLIIGTVTYRDLVSKKSTEITASSGQQQKSSPDQVKDLPQPNEPQQLAGSNVPAGTTPVQESNKRVVPVASDSKRRIAANRAAVTAIKPGETTGAAIEDVSPVRSADAETMTAMHFEKSERLLRAFRNVRLDEPGVGAEVSYERQKAQQLVYQNMMLRREADSVGDVQTATLLENLEPILIDIANLPSQPADDDIRIIKDRVERKNIVALLQVNSAVLARGLD